MHRNKEIVPELKRASIRIVIQQGWGKSGGCC
jgi:hypothetical protein